MFTIERKKMKKNSIIASSKATSTKMPATKKRGVNYSALISRFVDSQDVKPSSRGNYKRTIRQYFDYIQARGLSLDSIDRADLIAYKENLLSRLSPRSVASYLVSLRKFYAFAEAEKLYPNIARDLKTPHHGATFVKQHLAEDKIKELLDDAKKDTPRNFALINLLLRTGLRTIEAARANVGDLVTIEGRRVLKVWGKGRDSADAFVIVSDKAFAPLKAYLDDRNAHQGEPLFTSDSRRNGGGRLTTRTISAICKNHLVNIGLDSHEYTAHSLRHTTAVEILKSGGTTEDAQFVLRHSSPATTQIYTQSIKQEIRLKKAVECKLDDLF